MNVECFDHDGALARAGRLVPVLAAQAGEAERIRSVPPAVLDATVDSGLLAVVSPTRWGGMGLGLDTLGGVTRTLARGCPAMAWTLSFLMLHNWFVSRFPAPTQAEVLGDRPWAAIPAPLAPTGELRRTGDGFVLDGRWEWATGVNHADWVMVHAVELDATGGAAGTRFALVPIDEVTVEDVWFTSGMRATGSNAVRIDALPVPERRTIPGPALLAPGRGDDGLDPLPLMSVLALVAAAPAVGAAEAAVELFSTRMRERVLAYSLGDRQADQPAARIRLSDATAEVTAAAALWSGAIDRLDAAAGDGDGVTLQDRGAARLAAAAAVRMSRHAISTVCEGSGAGVYAESSPLQRLQRDVEVLKGHVVFDWDRSAELAGRIALGMELGPTDMV